MGGKLFFGEETGMDRKKARILHCSGEAAIAVTGGKYKTIIVRHKTVMVCTSMS